MCNKNDFYIFSSSWRSTKSNNNLSLIRDIVYFVPLVIIIPQCFGVVGVLSAAPISDLIGIIISVVLLILLFKKIEKVKESARNNALIKKSTKGVIITISREYGSQGKYIGELVN